MNLFVSSYFTLKIICMIRNISILVLRGQSLVNSSKDVIWYTDRIRTLFSSARKIAMYYSINYLLSLILALINLFKASHGKEKGFS